MASAVEIIIKARDEASREIDAVKKALAQFGPALAAIGIAAASAKKMFDFSKEGAAIAQTARSFQFFTDSVLGVPDALSQLREASRGTIDDMTLMSGLLTLTAGLSNEMAAEFTRAAPQLLEIAKAAQKLNPSLGDTAFLYESITRGIKRNSPLILDNLGIVVKVGEANQKYADSMGKTVEEMTAAEKQQALLNAVLETGDGLIQQVGGNVDALGDSFAQVETEITNFKDAFKAAFGENFAETQATQIDGLKIALEKLTGTTDLSAGQIGEFFGVLATGRPDLIAAHIELLQLSETLKAATPADQLFRNYREAGEGIEGMGEAAGEASEEMEKLAEAVAKLDLKQLKTDAGITEDTFTRLALALGGEADAIAYLEKVLKDAGQASDDYAVSQDQVEEATKAADEAMEAAADAAKQYADALAAIASATQAAQFGNIEALMEAQQQLAASQGEWVSGHKDTTAQIAAINEKLSADLTSEEKEKWGEILDTAAEGSEAWLAAYNALEGDLSDSARNAAIAARAALEGEMGQPFTAFTGDLEGIDEANEAIRQITEAIRTDYANAVIEAMMITDGFDESVANMAVTLGLMTQEEANLKLAAVEASNAINELGPAIEAGFGGLGDVSFAFFFDELVAAAMTSADEVEAVMDRIRRAMSGEDLPIGEWNVDEAKQAFLPEFQEEELTGIGAGISGGIRDGMLEEAEGYRDDFKEIGTAMGEGMKEGIDPEIQMIMDKVGVELPAYALENPTEIQTNAAMVIGEFEAIISLMGQMADGIIIPVSVEGGAAGIPASGPGGSGIPATTAATGYHGIIPPGYPNDTYTIGVTSGEEVHIGQPGAMGGGGFTVNYNYMNVPSWMDNPRATMNVVASTLSNWSKRAR